MNVSYEKGAIIISMLSMTDLTLSSLTLACLFSSFFLLNRMKKLKFEIDEKKFDIQTTEENLWQLNTDISRSILTKLRLLDRLSSSQV
jgi:hypothetical protein